MSRSSPSIDRPAHESAALHVTGQAAYVADLPLDERALFGRVVWSPHAHARIRRADLQAARDVDGVHAVLAAADIPGHNQMGPVFEDEPVLAADVVECVGQAVFLIAAETEAQALEAAALIDVEYEPLPAIIELSDAIASGEPMHPPRRIASGDCDGAMKAAPHTLEGVLEVGGQEHWYLETQSCLCLPGEEGQLVAWSSTQHPSETQAVIAEVLGVERKDVEVHVRRMGGAFGGKETQANHAAAWCALLAAATDRPVLLRLFRDDDQHITGKRHPYRVDWRIGFDDDGRLLAYDVTLDADGGIVTDLSMAVLERAMMHAENSYRVPAIRIIGRLWKTNTPSNTAFRGFGGPQGMTGIEHAIDCVARKLGRDAAELRALNFYAEGDRTPYDQRIENNRLPQIHERLLELSEYPARRRAVDAHNASDEFCKRGLAMTPVKFGISFTTSFLNQAGALVHLYRDGSLLVNHGGTEMGQGLHTKIRQIAALEMGLPIERVRVNATDTAKVPNTSATAASAGTDHNGMAVTAAIESLKQRLEPVARELLADPDGDLVFAEGRVSAGDASVELTAVIDRAYLERIQLSATGFYRTPDIHFDRDKGQGTPFAYFAYGMAVTEVEVDTLTGHVEIRRTDIVHDVGDSINPRIDVGQVEGGYVQGVGWCTTEEVRRDERGWLLQHSPDTYKIPGVRDIPYDFRVELLRDAPNPKAVRRSKAVAEPPLMLGLSAWLAIKDALSAVGQHRYEPDFRLPMTNEVIARSAAALRERVR